LHHVVDIQKRVNAILLVSNLEGQFEIFSSGFWGESVHGDLAWAEVTHERRERHSISPGSREILDIDVAVATSFALDPKEERLLDKVGFRGEVFVLLSFILLLRSTPSFPLQRDHSGSDVGLLHPGLSVDSLNRLHHLLQDVQSVACVHVDPVNHARHGCCCLVAVAVVAVAVVAVVALTAEA